MLFRNYYADQTLKSLTMKDLFLKHDFDNQTPLVDFKVNGELKIEGRSFPEDPLSFFEPVINWLKELKTLELKVVTMTVRLEYFNTSTSKLVLYMFKILEDMHNEGQTKSKIIWLCNKYDEDMVESGKDYKSLVDIPFELVEYE